MKRIVLLKAIEEYEVDVKNNPESYKKLLGYKGE
jgi:hypothetical protein